MLANLNLVFAAPKQQPKIVPQLLQELEPSAPKDASTPVITKNRKSDRYQKGKQKIIERKQQRLIKKKGYQQTNQLTNKGVNRPKHPKDKTDEQKKEEESKIQKQMPVEDVVEVKEAEVFTKYVVAKVEQVVEEVLAENVVMGEAVVEDVVMEEAEAEAVAEETAAEAKQKQVIALLESFKEREVDPVEDKLCENFSDLKICDKLKEMLAVNKFEKLTNVQRDAIPVILKNRNTIVKAETGSGKTLTYLVPLIEYLSQYSLNVGKIHRETSGTMAIIFAPTRELAMQIDIEVRKLLKNFYYMVCTTLMGGENPKSEKKRLEKGCVILICTPGRLLYHLENTSSMKFNNLQYMIFDEADRMLDLGFEKEMNKSLRLIKKKCPNGFKDRHTVNEEDERVQSNTIKMNFVSATMNKKVEDLGNKLMLTYAKVGFSEAEIKDGTTEKEEDINNLVESMPKQVQQYYIETPTQYRLLYLLAFLYSHQSEKIIVFLSNCEHVNFVQEVLKNFDWNKCGRRAEQEDKSTAEKQLLFNGNIFKLHGEMNHESRKTNYFGFDKIDLDTQDPTDKVGGVLIATDVASRGLDFKSVTWIIQYDISSQIKEYINRVGRTARIATSGSALSFVLPNENKYVSYLSKKYKITINQKSRFVIQKDFEKHFSTLHQNKNMKYKAFRELVNIEDIDEKQESLHAIRQCLTKIMLEDSLGLKYMGQIARASSTRAYAGHSSEMKHIFDLKELNLTEYARSFGLYKQLYQTAKRERSDTKKMNKKELNSLLLLNDKETKMRSSVVIDMDQVNLDEVIKTNQNLYSRRLQKSKIKDIEKELRVVNKYENQRQYERLNDDLKKAKTDVFTDERKLEQRKMGFHKAKMNVKKTFLSEFM